MISECILTPSEIDRTMRTGQLFSPMRPTFYHICPIQGTSEGLYQHILSLECIGDYLEPFGEKK